ncbi:MAG: nucleotide exchange factor GrpE [Eubacterium sp.]
MSKKKNEKEDVKKENTDIEETTDSKEAKSEEKESEQNPLEKELNDTKDRLLRVNAEYANFRKRSEKEKSESFNFAIAKAVGEILSAVDNLERAIANEQEDYEGLKKGVQMTYDGLMASLEKLGVTAYGEAGEQFDPNYHNAVMHIEDDSLDANVITDVFQRGYKINEKVVRPAMVKTAN